MRKKFLRIAAILVLLLILLIGFLQLRQYRSYKNRIHNKADIVVKVNVDGIVESLAWNAVAHPSYYIRIKKSTSKDTAEIKKGIRYPANVFLYTVKGKAESTVFAALPVSDTGDLKKYAARKLGIDSFYRTSNISMGSTANGKVTMAFNNRTVAFAYSATKEPVTDILQDMVTETNMRSSSDSLVVMLRKSDDHIVVCKNDMTGGINFESGKIAFSTAVDVNSFLQVEDSSFHRKVADDVAIYGWLNANFKSVGGRDFAIKNYMFSGDSLLKNYKGYIDFQWGNKTVIQYDTVITYGYNDNFEKVEESTVKIDTVPEIDIAVKSNGYNLFSYLQSTDAIRSRNILNREIFPLYTFYITPSDSLIHFSTVNQEAVLNEEQASPYFFYLFASIETIKNFEYVAFIKEYIENMRTLELKATKSSADAADVSGVISFVRSDINALAQMF